MPLIFSKHLLRVSFIVTILLTVMALPYNIHANWLPNFSLEQELDNGPKAFGKGTQLLINDEMVLAVNSQLTQLVAQSEQLSNKQDISKANAQVKAMQEQASGFNAAEHYLFNVVKANIAKANGEFNKAVNWLKKAFTYEDKLAEKQLKQELFVTPLLTLSNVYSEQGEFKLAFETKKKYFDRYVEHRQKIRDDRIEKLNEKYETDLKQKQNKLLASQNEFKQLQLKESENEKNAQIRNILILLGVGILFVVLLVRQMKIRKQLKILAKTDPLTGLHNRRSLFKRGELQLAQAIKNKQTLSAILLDIDFFKSVNDQYGHNVGDEVIKVVASIGEETMRSRDFFARLGGEEFAAILPGSSIKEAKAVAERFREKVQQFDMSPFGVEHPVTVSIGVANLEQVEPKFDLLLHAADEAMYNAKEQGRNRVCIYKNS